jgi:serine-type D-Ala-D-Ala carboxypeptidase/endopeptidase (penicillin-binding protein 4)
MWKTLLLILIWLPCIVVSQEKSLEAFVNDSAMIHASISFCVLDAVTGEQVFEYNSGKSLTPASILKLITSAASLELLGPDYTFKTSVGYSGNLKKRRGRLSGSIIVKGGGDPSLGSNYFSDHYGDFIANWLEAIKNAGIKRIDGMIIADDSYYDYLPVPSKWLWEDVGNYYGAGAYGLSVYDNVYEIHFRTTTDSLVQVITGVVPKECHFEFQNWLVAAGTADERYVFAAPYSTNGWLTGTIPANNDDYILKASITDPPLLTAKILDQKLKEAGIKITGKPTTARLQQRLITETVTPVSETTSPPLKEIIEVLNHISINLYAEHLIKELGMVYKNSGTTVSGVEVIKEFLLAKGINTDGMFIEDGSGLSPLDAINSKELANLLLIMKKNSKYFTEYYNSLPEAGKEGTLIRYFKDPVFDSRIMAKSGSMTRVRSFAGYMKPMSGRELIFCIIVNHFSGTSESIINGIEEILKETILNK